MLEKLKKIGYGLKREITFYQRVLKDPRTPLLARVLLGVAVAYALLPFDLIPDFIPIVGHLDDLILVPLLIIIALKMIPKEIMEDCRKEFTSSCGS